MTASQFVRSIGTAAIGLLVFYASPASASLVQVRDAPGGEDPFSNMTGYFQSGLSSIINGTLTNGGPLQSLGVGAYGLEMDFGNGFTPVLSYCLQPTEIIGFGLHPNDLVGAPYQTDSLTASGFTAQEADWIEILWANAYDLSLTSRENSAAFQAVIWEFAQDDPEHFFTSGNFALNFNQAYTLNVILTARAWLDNILDGTWTDHTDLVALTSSTSQDFVVPASYVPGPGGLAAMLLGAAGGMGRSRRRR